MRISEVHDTGSDVSRYQFYERLKDYLATPPVMIPCKDKYIPKTYVMNVMGVIQTSNHETDGVYLPADDRRTYVMSSNAKLEDFEPGYFDKLWSWYENEGGYGHVAAYLAQRDLSRFNPKAPPKKTPAFWRIVNANRSPEEGDLSEVIDRMKNPKAFTLNDLIENSINNNTLYAWLKDHKNHRLASQRLKACEYEPVHSPDREDGLWRTDGGRKMIYVKKGLSTREQIEAARELIANPRMNRPNFTCNGDASKGNGDASKSAKPKDGKTKHATYARKCRRPKRPTDYDKPLN
jgi:hypothetical protein